ncbi:MAG: hypothetical protein KC496_17545, partial [Anaerolineae bacterium]|nr:hypothetical protein [Anaerolineae bacterium]
MDSTIFKNIRGSNTRLILFGLLALIAGIAALVLTTVPYFVAKFTGPVPISMKELVSTEVNFIQPLYFREVTGEEMFDSGYYYETYDSDTGAVTNTDYFGLLYLGSDRFLLVRTEDRVDEGQTTYVGSLTTISDEIQRDMIDDLRRELGADADTIQFLPVMLDTRDSEIFWYVGAAIVAVQILFGVRGVVLFLQRTNDPYKHPALKKLGRYGDVRMVVDSIEQDLALQDEVIGKNLHLTRNWVVFISGGNIQATRYSDLVWLYKHT